MKKYAASFFSFGMAFFFLAVHLVSGWVAFVQEAAEHNQKASWSSYLVVWLRDVSENMQSEFFQLGFQFWLLAGGISLLWVRVHAYEQDIEDLREKLDRVLAIIEKDTHG